MILLFPKFRNLQGKLAFLNFKWGYLNPLMFLRFLQACPKVDRKLWAVIGSSMRFPCARMSTEMLPKASEEIPTKGVGELLEPRKKKKTYYFPVCWLFNRDPYNGLL